MSDGLLVLGHSRGRRHILRRLSGHGLVRLRLSRLRLRFGLWLLRVVVLRGRFLRRAQRLLGELLILRIRGRRSVLLQVVVLRLLRLTAVIGGPVSIVVVSHVVSFSIRKYQQAGWVSYL